MELKMKNILWYARDGHLDFYPRLSAEIRKYHSCINHFVCNNTAEKNNLLSRYNIEAECISEFYKNHQQPSEKDYYLNKLQKLLKYPLRQLAWSEMFEQKYTDKELTSNLIKLFQFWDKTLNELEVDIVVSERPSILSTSILWSLCDAHNIQFIDFMNIGIDGRVVFTSSWHGLIDGFEEKYAHVEPERSDFIHESLSYLQIMTKKINKPEYIFRNVQTGKIVDKKKLYIDLPKLVGVKDTIIKYRKLRQIREFYLYKNKNYINEVFNAFKMFIKLRILDRSNLFDLSESNHREKYFVLPLHVLHEWSNYSWMGIKYPSIICVIKTISACLPIDYKLYVKEHTTNFPEKSLSFYKTIKKIPGVKLIDRNVDTDRLLRYSRGIITLGSTMGWEGFLIGKPVVLLGKAWYHFLPGIYSPHDSWGLVELLQNLEDQKLATEKEKLRAVVSLYELSFDAKRYSVRELIEPANVIKYVEPFLRKMFA